MQTVSTLVLGGGLSGVSASHCIGHEHCFLLEAAPRLWGLLATRKHGGFTWDNGPHVSFTSNPHVQNLFAVNSGEFREINAVVGNYFHGIWVRHPAQVNLFPIPKDIRDDCIRDIKELQEKQGNLLPPKNYQEWLDASLGRTFTRIFSTAYTRKYWTVSPADMSCDWVGSRVHRPKLADVISGAENDNPRNRHYISKFRYPLHNGYIDFVQKLADGLRYELNAQVCSIDLERRQVETTAGETYSYERLVSTIPLPDFIKVCKQATPLMHAASRDLFCTSVLLVEIELPYSVSRQEHWFYVYDEMMFSTRINFTEKLSPFNAPVGHAGVQVEVYFSTRRPLVCSEEEVSMKVLYELTQMGIVRDAADPRIKIHYSRVSRANVTFLVNTAASLEVIWGGLAKHGLLRETSDTNPVTSWALPAPNLKNATLVMAGRFGQWKYFWTDDCVLRAKQLRESGFSAAA
jgi:protoporphyrinogen oxidase